MKPKSDRSGRTQSPRQKFSAKQRLEGDEFAAVFAKKQSVSDQYLILYGLRNDCGCSRLGLTVSRRVGPAHLRNRWKRAIREAFRRRQHELPANMDLVVLPRGDAVPLLHELEKSLVELARRLDRKKS